jgi:glyoxylase-like metal-dependent hydrolase (beta-lactamase superfamily II)
MKIVSAVVGALRVNCYFAVNNNNETAIIDPGSDFPKIKETVERMRLRPLAVILTHGHFDHIMAAAAVKEAYSVPIYAAEAEKDLLANPAHNGSALIRKNYSLIADEWLHDGDTIFEMKVIATPGHTAGSLCFYMEREELLLSGDTLFRGSYGRTDLPTGNFKVLRESVTEKLFSLPNKTIVHPGHDQQTTIGYEKVYSPILGLGYTVR